MILVAIYFLWHKFIDRNKIRFIPNLFSVDNKFVFTIFMHYALALVQSWLPPPEVAGERHLILMRSEVCFANPFPPFAVTGNRASSIMHKHTTSAFQCKFLNINPKPYYNTEDFFKFHWWQFWGMAGLSKQWPWFAATTSCLAHKIEGPGSILKTGWGAASAIFSLSTLILILWDFFPHFPIALPHKRGHGFMNEFRKF